MAQLTALLHAIAETPPITFNPAPEWSALGIELLVYTIAVLCFRDARRAADSAADPYALRGGEWLALMLSAIGLTFVIEMALSHSQVPGPGGQTVRLYEYPPETFLLQVFGVPVWVPVGWSFILYATMRTTTLLGLRWYVAPLLDGFLALNLDLTLDPIAIHRAWWDWFPGRPGTGIDENSYFGIPLVNFMGWFVIVGSFSFFARLLFHRRRRAGATRGLAGDLVTADLAAMAAFVVVMIYQVGLQGYLSPITVTLAWMAFGAVVMVHARAFRTDAPLQRLLVSVPIVFHGYSILCAFVTTTQSPPSVRVGPMLDVEPELAIFMPVAALLGLWLYFWPYLGGRSSAPAHSPEPKA